MGNKKDINLLPEEYRFASSRPSSDKRKDDGGIKEVGNSIKGLMDIISSKVSSLQNEKVKGFNSNTTKSLKNNISESISQNSEKPSGLPYSLKRARLRNLEDILNLSKKDLVVSSKFNYVYCTDFGKVVIIDKDSQGQPKTVTIKEADNISVKTIKFHNAHPFLYPKYNESSLPEQIIYMDKNEIWYLADSEAIIVTFKNDTPDVLKISLANLKQNNNLKVVLNYIGCHKFLYQNKKLQTILLEERKIKTEDIIRVQDHYALYKEGNDSYRVLLFDELKNISNEFTLTELPNVNEEAWDVLFTNDIFQYVQENGYSFSNFRQDNDYIEYWQNIGSKSVCVMRCKI
ncbi:hypothetical protein M972_111890 [Acetivibrio thermocellus AD2]|jgi:hypothetical protein|uniref:Uncharacterized protein n=1 Tax=Acetivibrio thermocellus AD2 TaxID=1138384 RepID=A0AB36TGR7_ACETH|nr:hypothetical protein [Acetivibrio thermocellus]ADU74866.1 hypothetical protein Clo1313_1810 [Acetivibrio thermocellus DSM 1313]ALX08821.1 hypothetical protein AD2_01831 [Acetivibrio thermocellus AD2]ANV76571.1 hypothetical protein LQRI_1830 [Acetivibrio thermocellus DSM 2360]EIC05162.1 hypothetical protein YSBL_1136 [Acetivibrio thermocellus YS]PFH03094.1 hypothetical protein M972_111890 [Acetivibrio thermocellus AD2]